MAAFCSQVYNQKDTLYLLPGEDRRYINEKIRRGCLPKTGRLPGGIRLQAVSRSVGRSYIRQPSARIKDISGLSAQGYSY